MKTYEAKPVPTSFNDDDWYIFDPISKVVYCDFSPCRSPQSYNPFSKDCKPDDKVPPHIMETLTEMRSVLGGQLVADRGNRAKGVFYPFTWMPKE